MTMKFVEGLFHVGVNGTPTVAFVEDAMESKIYLFDKVSLTTRIENMRRRRLDVTEEERAMAYYREAVRAKTAAGEGATG